MNLTEKSIMKLMPGKEREQYLDDETTGFGVRVDPNGRKSFFWFAKVNGKPRFRALGEFPAVSVKAARTDAEKLKGDAARWKLSGYSGPDPFEKHKRAEPTAIPTFQQLLDAYVERHVREHANNPERAKKATEWMAKKYFGTWTDRPIDAVTVEDVLTVKNALGKKRYAANRCVEFCHAIFAWAAGRTDGKVNFWPVENPAKDVESFPEKRRVRFLQPEELVRFNSALTKEPSADLRDFLTIAMATGARKSEIFSMKWADVKWEREIWNVPYAKNGQARDVSILPAALAVLRRRKGRALESEEYVFPGVGKTGHLTDLKKRWSEFRKRAQLLGFRLHDVRHTHASYQAIAGVSLQQIGAALGHKSLQSTQVYAHLHEAAVREAREAGQQKMVEMMKAAKERLKAAKKRTQVAAPKPKLLAAAAGVSRG